jgi:sugar phosphate isomerase/epimerase
MKKKDNTNFLLNRGNWKYENLFTRRQFIGSIIFATAGASLISSCKTSRWQIGCYTRPWAKYDFRVAFDGMAEAGFKFAGLMTSDKGRLITADTTAEQANTIGQEAKLRDLKIVSAYSNIDVKKSVAEGISGMKKIIDNLNICGCSNLLLGGIGNPELVDDYYKVVAECCGYAAAKGVGISVKPHGGINATGPECRAIVEKVANKNFGIWYDPGNIYFYSNGQIDPVTDSKEVDGMVVGMSVKDFLSPKNVDVTPGTGMVDFPTVLTHLRQGGFTQGPLIVECLSMGDLAHINAEAIKARQFLEKLIS